jgi:excinuclease ABC subunit B
MGRAARNVNGKVVLYADAPTDSMLRAIEETERRRRIQERFNEEHGFTPTTIEKEVGETSLPGSKTDTSSVSGLEADTPEEAEQLIESLERRMGEAADNLEFELAADIRDRIQRLEAEFELDVTDDEGVPAPEEF